MAKKRATEALIEDDDIAKLLGPVVLEICKSMGKPGEALAKSLTALTPNEALCALLGYRALPDDCKPLLSSSPGFLGTLQENARKAMAVKENERRLATIDMEAVISTLRKKLAQLSLSEDLADALSAHDNPRQAIDALVTGRGVVPRPVQTAFNSSKSQRSTILQVTQSVWQSAVSA